MLTRVFAVVILVFAGFCSGARAQHQVAEWISQERIGAWEDPLNWSTPQFPDNTGSNTYDVVITNGVTASFHQSLLVNKCLLGSEPYRIELYGMTGNTLTILDRFTWQGGMLSGWQARYDCFGEVDIVSDVTKTLTRECVLTLHDDTYWMGGDLDFTGYSVVWNLAGATFHVQTSRTIGDTRTTAASEFHNLGTVKTVGQGIDANFAVYFHHSGHLDVSNGLLRVTEQFDGPGSLYVGPGGRVLFRDRITIGGNAITNLGSMRFENTQQYFTLEADTDLPGTVELDMNLRGEGDITFDRLTWEGGDIAGSGAMYIRPGGELHVVHPVYLSRPVDCGGNVYQSASVQSRLPGGAFHSRGDFVVDGDPIFGGEPNYHTFHNYGTYIKRSGAGTNRIRCPIVLHSSGSVDVREGGLAFEDGIAGGCEIAIASNATLRCRWGELDETTVVRGHGTLDISSNLRFSGAMESNLALRVSSASVFSETPYTIRQFDIGSGNPGTTFRFQGSATFHATESMRLNACLLQGQGDLVSHGVLEMDTLGDGSSAISLAEERALVNRGVGHFRRGDLVIQSPTARFENFGTLDLHGSNDLVREASGKIENHGAIRTVSAATDARLELTRNEGALLVPEGRLTVIGGAPLSGDFETAADGTLTLEGVSLLPSATLAGEGRVFLQGNPSEIAGSMVVSGSVAVLGSTVTFQGSSNHFAQSFAATNGAVRLLDAALDTGNDVVLDRTDVVLSNGVWRVPDRLTVRDGTLCGFGTVQGDLSLKGQVGLGRADAPHGILTITGDVLGPATNAASDGVEWTFGIDGHRAGVDFTPIVVTGTVSLAGSNTLQILIGEDFEPAASNAPPLVLLDAGAGLVGSFLNAANGMSFRTQDGSWVYRIFYGPESPYDPDQVVVTHIESPFDAWRRDQFSTDDLEDPSQSGPGADPDGNGLSNVEEFVFGYDHGAVDPIRYPQPFVDGTEGQGAAYVRLVERVDKGRIRIQLERADRLPGFWYRFDLLGPYRLRFALTEDTEANGFRTRVWRYEGSSNQVFIRSHTVIE